MGCFGKQQWSVEDLGFLYEQYEAGVPMERLAEQFGRSRKAVHIKLNAAGYYTKARFKDNDRGLTAIVKEDKKFQDAMRNAGYEALGASREPGTEQPVGYRALTMPWTKSSLG